MESATTSPHNLSQTLTDTILRHPPSPPRSEWMAKSTSYAPQAGIWPSRASENEKALSSAQEANGLTSPQPVLDPKAFSSTVILGASLGGEGFILRRTYMLWLFMLLPIVLFGVALLILWIPLPPAFPEAFSQGRNLMAAVLTGLLGLGYLGGITVYVISSFSRAGQALDILCEAEGLSPQGASLWGRRCQGNVQNHTVTLHFNPAQGVRAAKLDIYVAAESHARIALGMKRPLLDCRQCEAITLKGPEWADIHILAADPEQACAWLTQSQVQDVITSLLNSSQQLGSRDVYIQPERIWLRAHLSANVTEKAIQEWLRNLLTLADLKEGAGLNEY